MSFLFRMIKLSGGSEVFLSDSSSITFIVQSQLGPAAQQDHFSPPREQQNTRLKLGSPQSGSKSQIQSHDDVGGYLNLNTI